MNKQFEFFGYSSLNNGTYTLDGKLVRCAPDFRRKERYQEYKDAGMTVLFPQFMASRNYEEAWEDSKLKEVMDDCADIGLKVIVLDRRFIDLTSRVKESLIGEGDILSRNLPLRSKFKNQDQLDKHVAHCMKDYCNHPAFYGVMLADEPHYNELHVLGEVYQSIKRVCPKAFIQCALCPTVYVGEPLIRPTDQPIAETFYENWRLYVNKWLDVTKADYFMYDQYPLCTDHGVYPTYLRTLQIAAEISRDRAVSFKNITQTCAYGHDERVSLTRKVALEDSYYLTNLLMGLGVDTVAYFTYWTKQTCNHGGEFFHDDGSFVNRDGTKTKIYYNMQKIMSEMQAFAPIVLRFTYSASALYKGKTIPYPSASAEDLCSEKPEKIKDVCVDAGYCFVSQLVNRQTDEYLYMIMNINDPQYFDQENARQNVQIKLAGQVKQVTVYEKGKAKHMPLEGAELKVSLRPGEAIFVQL